MSEPQYYELHKCLDCNVIFAIIGFDYDKNWEKKILFKQFTQTAAQGAWHALKGLCKDMVKIVVMQNPDYKPRARGE